MLPNIIREFINLILTISIIPQIKSPELEPIIMPALEPAHHRMVVCFPDHVLVGPYLIRIEYFERLLVLCQGVSEVRQSEGIVVVSTILLDAD